MQISDLFAYLSAFVTIVLALGLCDMLQSLHRLLDARERVRWRVLPLAAAALVFILVVSEFFSLTLTFGIARITYFGVVGLLVVPVLATLAAFAALPDQVPDEGLDLMDFYDRNRRYLFGILAVASLADVVRSIMTYAARHGGVSPDLGVWTFNIALLGVVLAAYGLMIWISDRRVQAAGLVVLIGVILLGVSSWSVETRPKAGAATTLVPSASAARR